MQGFDEYVTFFENLAINHVDIAHQANVSGEKSFFTMSLDELLEGFRTQIDEQSVVMALIDYDYVPDDNGGDSMKQIDGGFVIMKHYDVDDFQDKREAKVKTEEVTDDILRRMRDASRTQDADDTSLFYNSYSLIDRTKAEAWDQIGGESFIGYYVTFRLSPYWDPCVDDTKWSDLP